MQRLFEKKKAKVVHQLHPKINPFDLSSNGFLLSDQERKRVFARMDEDGDSNEIVSEKSAHKEKNDGAILINRDNHSVYKIYKSESNADYSPRKKLSKAQGTKILPRGALGVGGFGKVYICQDQETGVWHAVKIIKRSYTDTIAYIFGCDAFNPLHEVEMLKQQGYFIDLIVTPDKYYIVEILIEGVNCHKAEFQGSTIEIVMDEVLNLIKNMAQVVADFHENECLHRDIAINSFMYNKAENNVYLIDFGASKQLEDGRSFVVNFLPICKSGFTAPEVYVGLNCYSSDIYSLGATFDCILEAIKLEAIKQKVAYSLECFSELKELTSDMQAFNLFARPGMLEVKNRIDGIIENKKDQAQKWYR